MSVDVEVRLKLRDAATAGIKTATQAVQQEAVKAATATEKAAAAAAAAAERGAAQQRTSFQRMAQARETLGIRSEHAIQREIARTEAAYQRLRDSGTLSFRQQAHAADAMRRKVTELTNEMGRMTAMQRAAAGMKFAGAAAAGIWAAGHTLKGPAAKAMNYDQRLAHMVNVTYTERDAAGRQMGKQTLENAVNQARRQGGGTREQTAEALDTLIASGTVSVEDAMAMLPDIMKSSTASNTNANELATIAIRAKKNFNISAKDIPSVLSAALVAGQAGGFELNDMAKWLPPQMAMAGNLGITGKDGFAKLAAWNQASVITAGTKDEAGNNLRDLLNEVNTPHFRKYIADQYLADGRKSKKGEKEKRMKSVDQIFLDYQDKGVDKVSATMDMMQTILEKDKTYQGLQAKLRQTKKEDLGERQAILEAMTAQVQGTSVGKVFHNQQSLMAYLGLANNKEYAEDVLGKVRAEFTKPHNKSETATSYEVIASTAAYKKEQADQDFAVGQKAAMDELTPAIGRAAEAFSDLASKHPLLVGSVTLATTALGALAGTAGLAAIAMGGKGIPLGGATGRAAAWATASRAGQATLAAGKAGSIGGVAAMAGGYALGKVAGEDSAITRYGTSAMNGAAFGATVGATLGTVVPGLGNAIGLGVGAAIGGVGGLAWEGITDLLKPAEQKPVDVNAKMTVDLAPGLVLREQIMQATGPGQVQMVTGNVWNGAP